MLDSHEHEISTANKKYMYNAEKKNITLKLSDVVSILLMNTKVKMPIIVGILKRIMLR